LLLHEVETSAVSIVAVPVEQKVLTHERFVSL